MGDPTDSRTFGGTPFFLLEAGRRIGFFDAGLPLSLGATVPYRRVLWNLGQLLRYGQAGGFQFSDQFLNHMWDGVGQLPSGSTVVNLFQLYPERLCKDRHVRRWYYIDQTLKQLVNYYSYSEFMSNDYAELVVGRERDQYLSADGIVVTSKWARKSVVEDYGVPSSLVHIVVRGANVDKASVVSALSRRDVTIEAPSDRELTLLFAGKDWRRKGLHRLLRAFGLARQRGANLRLRVVGPEPKTLPEWMRRTPGIEWFGRIDKVAEGKKYMDLLLTSDIGCLLSQAEAGGIVLREYHLAGLAVVASDTGGVRDFALEDATTFVAPQMADLDLADLLFFLTNNRPLVLAQKAAARAAAATLTWDFAAKKLRQIIALGRS